MDTFKSVMMRIFAVIAAESLGVIGAGSRGRGTGSGIATGTG